MCKKDVDHVKISFVLVLDIACKYIIFEPKPLPVNSIWLNSTRLEKTIFYNYEARAKHVLPWSKTWKLPYDTPFLYFDKQHNQDIPVICWILLNRRAVWHIKSKTHPKRFLNKLESFERVLHQQCQKTSFCQCSYKIWKEKLKSKNFY